MKSKRHTPEQIIRKLREADKLQSSGATIDEICRKLQVSEQSFHRWRKQYGDSNPKLMKKLRAIEKENGRLKKAVADLTLDNQVLKEVAEGNF